MQNDVSLDYFQEKLIVLLLKGLPPEEIVFLLQSDPLITPYQSYIETFDLTMLSAASDIVKKWEVESAYSAL